ncbi:acyl-CoA dehydrogenase family protein [Actinokineospora globicatena]|uniref:acyl-CoA dehydrogenase family protein n=1 Tax=Actinokineospora globicatena TaxID=103729 RepID=UPI0020A5669C|nr:acyl-CoA dehydrogenase family protein [Actinokineospora globicatena]MCP2304908.1 Acyl-CoA dehydrogenase [Actinokineospora globicatena]GLW77711.1 acyl-CoA dehydrogenase [Actinokineospora globicatena]GLW85620.1 acyl-CoA dehydrogenase [Actinokineospora globicatena]
MNLLYTDIEEDLRASVADLLSDRAAPATVLARIESGADTALWGELARMGATSLHVSEGLGGQGAGYRETAVVAEELGRSVAPVPFLGSAVLATAVLTHLADDPAARALLGRLARGETTAALVVPLSSWESVPDGRGLVRSVADAAAADVLVVPVAGVVHLVDARDAVVTPVTSLDQTRPIADVDITGAPTTPLAGPGDDAVRAALVAGAGILASEQVGLAQWCLDTTVAYLKERHQFGRPVGSFQALKHRVADLWQSLVVARAAARHAADALTTGVDVDIAVSVAKSLCSTAAVRAAEECVQLHGGIGMTWEHPAHLYLKRAKADEIALGTPGRHRATLAPLVDLPLQSTP